MNKKLYLTIVAVSVLSAAGGISFGLKANREKNEALKQAKATSEQPEKQQETAEEQPAADAPLVELKELADVSTNDLAELRNQLAARDAELERLRAQLEERNNRGPRQSFQDRMEQLKEEDPERYAEIIQRRTERVERMRYDQATRLATFMNMDTSGMTEEELANHNQLIETLSEVWARSAEYDPEQAPDREAMREFFGTMREVGNMMDQERTVMFRQLGSDVGLSGTDAEDFAAYVEDIIETTSMRPPWRGRDRRPRGGDNGGASD